MKVMYNRRGVSDTSSTTRPGSRSAPGSPRSVPAARRAPRRPVRQPARRARGGGEDRGQAGQRLRRPRRDLRQPGECTPKLRQNLAEHEDQVRRNAEVIPLVRDVPLDVALDDLALGQLGRVERSSGLSASSSAASAWQRLAPLGGRRRGGSAPRRGTGAARHRPATVEATVPADADGGAALGASHRCRAAAPWRWTGWSGARRPVPARGHGASPPVRGADDAAPDDAALRVGTTPAADADVARRRWRSADGAVRGPGRLLGPGGERGRGPRVEELMRACWPTVSTSRSLALDTAVAAYLWTRSDQYRLEDTWSTLQLGWRSTPGVAGRGGRPARSRRRRRDRGSA